MGRNWYCQFSILQAVQAGKLRKNGIVLWCRSISLPLLKTLPVLGPSNLWGCTLPILKTKKNVSFCRVPIGTGNQWRISPQGACADGDKPSVSIDEVGVEENTTRLPFNYLTCRYYPRKSSTVRWDPTYCRMKNLWPSIFVTFSKEHRGCDVAINKLGNIDLNLYERLQMFVHAESKTWSGIPTGDVSIYIKLEKTSTPITTNM